MDVIMSDDVTSGGFSNLKGTNLWIFRLLNTEIN